MLEIILHHDGDRGDATTGWKLLQHYYWIAHTGRKTPFGALVPWLEIPWY
jgi:hypothetical protein